jgi:hypothetical protein
MEFQTEETTGATGRGARSIANGAAANAPSVDHSYRRPEHHSAARGNAESGARAEDEVIPRRSRR